MSEFVNALTDPNLSFLRYTFLSGILASIAFGIMGTYVVVRRISYLAGAISHSVLGGIGLSLYLKAVYGVNWLDPLMGAVFASLFAALVIGFVTLYAKEREDTVIGAIWAIGMALGLVFIAKTPGYIDPMSYLFGNILLISKSDMWIIIGLDILILIISILLYNTFQAVCFDEEFSKLRGLKVKFFYILLLCLTALTIVLLVSVVGIIMVIALLTLPPAIAGIFSKRLWHMMVLSIIFCLISTVFGLMFSYNYDLPSGPSIILIAGSAYLIMMLLSLTKRKMKA